MQLREAQRNIVKENDMKRFMDEDFLLSTETAKKLYHEYAETMPIIDYHCHISPQEIYEDRKFENIMKKGFSNSCRTYTICDDKAWKK